MPRLESTRSSSTSVRTARYQRDHRRGGESRSLREGAAEHADRVRKRESVGVLVGLPRGAGAPGGQRAHTGGIQVARHLPAEAGAGHGDGGFAGHGRGHGGGAPQGAHPLPQPAQHLTGGERHLQPESDDEVDQEGRRQFAVDFMHPLVPAKHLRNGRARHDTCQGAQGQRIERRRRDGQC